MFQIYEHFSNLRSQGIKFRRKGFIIKAAILSEPINGTLLFGLLVLLVQDFTLTIKIPIIFSHFMYVILKFGLGLEPLTFDAIALQCISKTFVTACKHQRF